MWQPPDHRSRGPCRSVSSSGHPGEIPSWPNTNAADGGGSNGSRVRLWKVELAKLASELGIPISVSHLPPGTSKWNKIEHRLFSHISMNWRGKPLVDHETIVSLIGGTTTTKGLRVRAELDRASYPTGIKVSDADIKDLPLDRDEVHPQWNYTLRPQA